MEYPCCLAIFNETSDTYLAALQLYLSFHPDTYIDRQHHHSYNYPSDIILVTDFLSRVYRLLHHPNRYRRHLPFEQTNKGK
jgi:hypothetical protein